MKRIFVYTNSVLDYFIMTKKKLVARKLAYQLLLRNVYKLIFVSNTSKNLTKTKNIIKESKKFRKSKKLEFMRKQIIIQVYTKGPI